MTFKKDLKLLLKPYYWLNIILSLSYIAAKYTPIVCDYVFKHKGEDSCELNNRETEILFFLLIVIMMRTRKNGCVTMINYLTSSFIYTKIANLILWSFGDIRFGAAYFVIFIIIGIIFPEPTYSGPEFVTYFRSCAAVEDEMNQNKHAVWLICFYTVWNPVCVNFAPVFAALSAEYHLDNLKFGKIDIGRYSDAGKKYRVSDSALSRQLPTVVLFKNGKEIDRRPTFDTKGKLLKFFFSEDNVKAAFGLNQIYKECNENLKKEAKKAIKNEKKNK